ncbi:hypothetical protein GW571_14780 (plasmid) [Clavibacter capsici]|uniref:Uncharacterized protein n=1 Tax=Clavibacter capsici TaxID=1874630 RepID=A0A0M5K0B4_9MICO|nr:hypothetical protein [Clavibacter capsici]ALD14422.1 hypothetical protein AES38_15225 [Clavibacter capsici]QIS40565.1 hypothetical protein GW572_15440 [Clavibacter capsici]QIS43503.1 hypothetical protein GW571_14780 [Clavibacter capsici]QIS46450.1 hypothetical protein GW570_14770 [Clavibacter capsici]
MQLAWTVLGLHVAAFLVPLIGVGGIYRRTTTEFNEARTLTAAATTVLAWHEAERKLLEKLEYGSVERAASESRLDTEYDARLAAAGLAHKTFRDLDVLMLTNGKSNLVAFASAVQITRSDALLVLIGLVLGLVANLIPTVWSVPALLT